MAGRQEQLPDMRDQSQYRFAFTLQLGLIAWLRFLKDPDVLDQDFDTWAIGAAQMSTAVAMEDVLDVGRVFPAEAPPRGRCFLYGFEQVVPHADHALHGRLEWKRRRKGDVVRDADLDLEARGICFLRLDATYLEVRDERMRPALGEHGITVRLDAVAISANDADLCFNLGSRPVGQLPIHNDREAFQLDGALQCFGDCSVGKQNRFLSPRRAAPAAPLSCAFVSFTTKLAE